MNQKILIILLFLVCTPVYAQVKNVSERERFTASFSHYVINTAALVENADKAFPEHFWPDDAERKGSEFDPNSFFTVLAHLKIQKGFSLDYVYKSTGMGGYPCLYVRKERDERLITFAQYKERYPDGVKQESILKQIETDGSIEALAELIAFVEYHAYFYNRWHDWFHKEIILSDQQMREVLDKWWKEPTSFDSLDEKERTKALGTAIAPTLTPSGDGKVDISFVLFAEGQGILKRKYTVTTTSPHQILHCTDTVVVTQAAIVR